MLWERQVEGHCVADVRVELWSVEKELKVMELFHFEVIGLAGTIIRRECHLLAGLQEVVFLTARVGHFVETGGEITF